jgi:hypothetical protein
MLLKIVGGGPRPLRRPGVRWPPLRWPGVANEPLRSLGFSPMNPTPKSDESEGDFFTCSLYSLLIKDLC